MPGEKLNRRIFLAAAAGIAVGCRRRYQGFLGYLFVANSEGGTVAVVDLSALAVSRWIRLGANPTLLADHPARPVVYALAPEEDLLFEISVNSLSAERRLRIGRGAKLMRLDGVNNQVHLLCGSPPRLQTVSADSFQVTRTLDLPGSGEDLDLSPDGAWMAVTLLDRRELLFCNTEGQMRTAKLESPAQLVRFRGDGQQLLLTHPETREISILEAIRSGSSEAARQVVRLPLSIIPEQLCFKKDGGQLFVAGRGEDAIAVIYPYRTEVAETFLVGKDPGAMAVSGQPEYLFVANRSSSAVTILNILSRKVMGVVHVGNDPCFIVITPDNRFAVVLNRASGDVAIIRLAAIGTNPRQKLTPLLSMVPVGSAPVHGAVRPL